MAKRKTIFALNENEIQQMRDYFGHKDPKYLFMFNFAINCGLRISDIIPIKVKTVRGKEEFDVVEQKTKKNRTVYVMPALQRYISEYTKIMGDEDYLFPSRQGKKEHIKRIMAYTVLNDAGKALGFEHSIGTHTLRRTFGTLLYNRTKDIVFVQRQLNHSSPSITESYLGLREKEDKEKLNEIGGF